MQDTSIEIKERYRRMLLEKTGIERMIMGANMAEAARAMALASMPNVVEKNEQRIKLFLRFYQNDFSAEEREQIIKHLRKGKSSK